MRYVKGILGAAALICAALLAVGMATGELAPDRRLTGMIFSTALAAVGLWVFSKATGCPVPVQHWYVPPPGCGCRPRQGDGGDAGKERD